MSKVLHKFTYDDNNLLCFVPLLDFDLLHGMGILVTGYRDDEDFLVTAAPLDKKQYAYVSLRYTAEHSGAVLREHANRTVPFYLAENRSNISNDWNTGSVFHE